MHASSALLLELLISCRHNPGLCFALLSCPNIESLGLAFDATNVGPPPGGRPEGVCHIDMTKFSVRCCPIEQLLRVALVLSQILLCFVKLEAEPWTWGANQETRRTKAEQGVRLYWSLCLDRTARSICLTFSVILLYKTFEVSCQALS